MSWRAPALSPLAAVAGLVFMACAGSGDGASGAPTAGDYRELAETSVSGYSANEVDLSPQDVGITYLSEARTGAGALVQVRVEVRACTPEDCRPLLTSEYKGPADQVGLKAIVAGPVAATPDLRWSFGGVELREGLEGLSARAVGFGGGWVNAYRAWYHDGTTLITLHTTPADAPEPANLEEADALLTTVEAFVATSKVFASFAHLFE
jgi:hypothetical protein